MATRTKTPAKPRRKTAQKSRVTIELDATLATTIRVIAAEHGKGLSEAIESLCLRALDPDRVSVPLGMWDRILLRLSEAGPLNADKAEAGAYVMAVRVLWGDLVTLGAPRIGAFIPTINITAEAKS